MNTLDPSKEITGTVLILVPHMDDAVLACGGTLAQVTEKDGVHLLYATDGKGILHHEPAAAARQHGEEAIGNVRRTETGRALEVLGLPPNNVTFLDHPEWQLANHADVLAGQIREAMRTVKPDTVLLPFRYDKHTDHVALHRIATRVLSEMDRPLTVLEYFVYYHWPLLPGGDIRRWIRDEYMSVVDIADVSEVKRRALDCFTSQTTCYFPWQPRPVLSDRLLNEYARGPEYLLRAGPTGRDRPLFRLPLPLLRLLHTAEPIIKNTKERLRGRLSRGKR